VGGSTLSQVEAALAMFPSHRIWLLHCVAQYPCPPENLRLGNIVELTRHFASDRVRVGYSGHEEGIKPSLAAIALGAGMVERHFCLSRHSFVHHIECSLEPDEFAELVRAAKSPKELAAAAEYLPPVAFRQGFGMSEVEKTFLVEQTYGTKFIKEPTHFPESDNEQSGVLNAEPATRTATSAA
jgi:sialic acid synthase SpsE